ncbi:hypothetical protein ACFYMO_00665 [Streptomyces sp. NPDC007025]|uniref:hypothetical protein n=1 Tax=Streptomyces sp. NPDC007025 TaxID=3364771 RepID=UPI0036B34BC9
MSRYQVTMLPDRTHWVILDRALGGYCALPDDAKDDHPNLLPLEWSSRPAAEAWLRKCFRAWGLGTVQPPRNWKPVSPGTSPWMLPDKPDQPPTRPSSFF